ncbi:MAG: tRNA uridine-5-carboxymethylaminomethyl(34) synthesis enzyme MnmG [Acidobacteria bacterium]|nr:tRNA uridine-5-carboxymethylaminomethyl(34) synthesis enzyme MnmG [Candidatus Sulfomarinibacter sp. MAG AM1]
MRTDLVVVGGGHAGCEAAAAAARMGASVVLVTLHRHTVGQMPCNPAIGGIGKGHLVAEIDALGGLQGWAADRTGIQFRTLNQSRGPAVWGPRVQCDKEAYALLLRRVIERLPGVTLIEGEVAGLRVDGDRVRGVELDGGEIIDAGAIILTTGTFLGGLLHTGDDHRPGGRLGERPSTKLGASLDTLGFELRRFKTGTPPRLARSSLDLSRLEVQGGDPKPRPFSWRTRSVRNRCSCWVTRTPPVVQEIIGENLHRSPLFSGGIDGVGPRYCPSIEDKVVRFPHHDQHTVFLEPEGVESERIYVNGLSTSLPCDVQEQVVRSVQGLERAAFLQYGYAVEYDVVAPRQIGMDLQSREVRVLYFAGQLLGTSGYEEAAALGLLAGINAVHRLRGKGEYIPTREDAYLGVLVDDVCGREHREPYRMFTSRAEHRLILGVDSARERLMPEGRRLGLVREAAFHVERERWRRRRRTGTELAASRLNPDAATRRLVRETAGIEFSRPTTWARVLRRHDVDLQRVATALPMLQALSEEDWRIVVGHLRYDGYLARHKRERERLRRLRHIPIPADLDPAGVSGLTREAAEALARDRPRTLADAERLPGITPAALAVLAGCVTRRRDEK